MRKVGGWIVGLAALAVVAGFTMQVVALPPDNATVYEDHRDGAPDRSYVTPPCLKAGKVTNPATATEDGFRPMKYAEVKMWREEGLPMKLDPVCERAGGILAKRSMISGLWGAKNDRWTAEGEWKR